LTFSRGVYVAVTVFLVALVGFAVFLRSREVLVVVVVVIAIVSVSAVSMNSLSYGSIRKTAILHGSEQQRRSSNGRLEVWSRTAQLIRVSPVFGTGPGTFAMRYLPKAGLGDGQEFVGRPLNTILDILVEGGVIALAQYILIIMLLCLPVLREIVHVRSFRVYPCAVLLLGICAFAIRELSFSSLLENPTLMLLFWVLLGMISLSFRSRAPQRLGWGTRLLFAAAILWIGYAFIEDHRRNNAHEFAARAQEAIYGGDSDGAVALVS
jgi:O-antigen ligase